MFSRSTKRLTKKLLILLTSVYFLGLVYNHHESKAQNVEKIITIPEANDVQQEFCSERPEGSQRSLNLFFVETTGEPCLTARQACSVESAARTNPHLPVTIYMEKNLIRTDNNKRNRSGLPGQHRSCRITDSLRQFSNVKFQREDLMELTKDTPLWALQSKGLMKDSEYPLAHRSDAVRVALIWKYGGLYMDLDVTVLRPLHCLQNTVGLVDHIPDWVENGVMTFDAGHKFVWFLMKYMTFAFKPDVYISLGPATLTDAIKYYCDTAELTSRRRYECRNDAWLHLQGPQAFYAIGNDRQDAFYRLPADGEDTARLRKSFLSHIYDAGNGRTVVKDCLYDLLAQEYCPTVHAMALDQDSGF